jgi:hypothetical protein
MSADQEIRAWLAVLAEDAPPAGEAIGSPWLIPQIRQRRRRRVLAAPAAAVVLILAVAGLVMWTRPTSPLAWQCGERLGAPVEDGPLRAKLGPSENVLYYGTDAVLLTIANVGPAVISGRIAFPPQVVLLDQGAVIATAEAVTGPAAVELRPGATREFISAVPTVRCDTGRVALAAGVYQAYGMVVLGLGSGRFAKARSEAWSVQVG